MKIQTKLILGLIIGSLALIGSGFLALQWSFSNGLIDYVSKRELAKKEQLATTLAQYYATHGNWRELVENKSAWYRILHQAARESGATDRPMRKPPRNPEGPPRSMPGGFGPMEPPPPRGEVPPPTPKPPALLDSHKRPLIGEYAQDFLTTPIELSGTIVGWLAIPPKNELTESIDIAFKASQNVVFLIIAGTLAILSICLSFPLARHFLMPLSQLGQATHALARGNYDVDLDLARRDELGTLAEDFNILANTLSTNENMRKRWIADVSHELRTPLAIIKGEVEAMQDGIRPLNQASLASVHQEVTHLEKLIQDLFELSNAELGALRYHKGPLNLNELVQESLEKYDHSFSQKSFAISASLPEKALIIEADETRLTQLLDNLLGNICKYTEPGAKVSIHLKQAGRMAQLCIEDSGPGVPPEALSHLFDYLYRVEHSRNRATGGSGLGLAICKRIVEAHNGRIQAQASALGGLAMIIHFPLYH